MTRISKYELITEIAMLCDEQEAYRRELADLKRDVEICSSANDCEGFNVHDLLCLNAGRKKIFSDCTYSWRKVTATRDGETGAIEVTTFEKFRDKVFNRCPDSMSKQEFFDYFDGEFRARYEEEKATAIADLRAEEQEGEDD